MSAQSLEALGLANARKWARAGIKRQLKVLPRIEGSRMAARVLEHPSDDVEGIRLNELVGSIYRYGPALTESLVRRALLHPACETKRIGDLTERQRGVLARLLREAA